MDWTDVTPEMIDAGKKAVEDNACRFLLSSKTPDDWAKALGRVYVAMRALEPKETHDGPIPLRDWAKIWRR